MRLNIAPDYALTKSDRTFRYLDDKGNVVKAEEVTLRQITANVVYAAVAAKYPQPKGIEDRFVSKTWARVSRALNRALESGQDAIEISAEGVDFLRGCLESYGAETRTVLVKEDLIDFWTS